MAAVTYTSGRGFNSGAASSLATGSQSPTAGSMLIASVFSTISAGAPAAPTLSSVFTATWTRLTAADFTYNGAGAANDTRLSIFYSVLGGSPGSGAITADWGGISQTFAGFRCEEYANFDTAGSPSGASAFIQVRTGNAGAATSFSDSFASALRDTNSMVHVLFTHAVNQVGAAGTGYTGAGSLTGGVPSATIERTTTAGSATQSFGGSWASSGSNAWVAVEIGGPPAVAAFVPQIINS